MGNPGDKHYKCYHGNRKIFTVSKAMNYSLHSEFFCLSESRYLFKISARYGWAHPLTLQAFA